jgi:hypothetical protein
MLISNSHPVLNEGICSGQKEKRYSVATGFIQYKIETTETNE